MSSWKERKERQLGELVDIIHGHPFPGGTFSAEPTGDILFTPGNIHPGGGFNGHKLKYYMGLNPEGYILSPGDIVVALTDLSANGDILGYAARVPGWKGKRFLHNQRIGRVVIRDSRLNEDFLYWLLRSPRYREHVLKGATGTTVKHSSPGRIMQYRFILPPPEVQQEVVGILELFETQLEIISQFTTTLEKMIMKIFHHLFPTAAVVPFPECQPNGWTMEPLSHFGKIICGKTPPRRIPGYFGGTVPFVKIPDMRYTVYITRPRDFLSGSGAMSQAKKEIPANSICVSCIATVGLVALTSVNCHTNQQINSIIPYHHMNRYYLYCLLKQMHPILESLATGGTATLNLSTSHLSKIRVPKPPREMLESFYRTVQPIFHRILLNARKQETIAAKRDKLLPRLLSGQYRPPRVK